MCDNVFCLCESRTNSGWRVSLKTNQVCKILNTSEDIWDSVWLDSDCQLCVCARYCDTIAAFLSVSVTQSCVAKDQGRRISGSVFVSAVWRANGRDAAVNHVVSGRRQGHKKWVQCPLIKFRLSVELFHERIYGAFWPKFHRVFSKAALWQKTIW